LAVPPAQLQLLSKSECSIRSSCFRSSDLTESKRELTKSKILRNNTKDGAEPANKCSNVHLFWSKRGNFFSRQTISSDAFKFPLRAQKPVSGTLFQSPEVEQAGQKPHLGA
jgi:hypothetical protein